MKVYESLARYVLQCRLVEMVRVSTNNDPYIHWMHSLETFVFVFPENSNWRDETAVGKQGTCDIEGFAEPPRKRDDRDIL
jgi:hypothetical protein